MVIIALPAMSQVGELRNNFSVGVNAGLNYNNVSFSPKIQQSGLIGYGGGLTARYISEKYFAMICGIQIELNYTQRGWKEKFEEDPNNPRDPNLPLDSYQRTLNYLEIPFLAHLAFGKERGGRFFINAGPQIAFLMSENEKYSESFNDGRNQEAFNKTVENKFDYGIVGGMGVEIRTKAGNFLLEGRYYFALSSIFKDTKKDYYSRSANNVILGRITYLMDLKNKK